MIMKKSRILSVSLLMCLLLWGGQTMAQCYQPTMNAARQEERGGNYQRAAQLYREAQNCFEATAQQKTAAKKKEAECRQRAQAAEQRQRDEEVRKAVAERQAAEAARQAEIRRQQQKEEELRRREAQLRKREEELRQQEQASAERKRKEEEAAAERKRKEEQAAAERKRQEEEAAAERKRKKENLTLTVGGVSFKMVWVEGGTFTMGCTPEQGGNRGKKSPAHSVTLDGYYMGETEVTQALWTAVMGTTVRQQRDRGGRWNSLYGEGDSYPMYYVNYHEAVQFARKLSELTGRNFSLPTEAEWEYAARGGSKSRGYEYAGSNDVDAVAWYGTNSGDKYLDEKWDYDKYDRKKDRNHCRTHPVGQKQANELGLYDLSGNVSEWCSDWFGDYGVDSQLNPKGPLTGSERVQRGGSWFSHGPWDCVVYARDSCSLYCDFKSGIRLVLRP